MPNFAVGNLWDAPDEYMVVVTGNSTVTKAGTLVMGRGCAKELRDGCLNIDTVIGYIVSNTCGSGDFYGFLDLGPKQLYVKKTQRRRIGILQVKYNWADAADLKLIENSLTMMLCFLKVNPNLGIACAFPGIGNGHLSKEQVCPLLNRFGNNITFYEKD